MAQTEIKIEESQTQFLTEFVQYGFKDESELVREALNRLRDKLNEQSLRESAELYAEIYAEDEELQELTETALLDFK